MRIFLTAGNVNDTVPAGEMLADLSADKLLADRAYDSDAVLEQARQQKMEVVTLPENADVISGSMMSMSTRSVIWSNAFLQSSSHFDALQPAMINWPRHTGQTSC